MADAADAGDVSGAGRSCTSSSRKNEEQEALATFGPEYRAYMAEVPGFIPRLGRLFGPGTPRKYRNS